MNLGAKVVFITGASSGIGANLAKRYAAKGYKVGLLARRVAQLAELKSQINAQSGIAEYAVCDVQDQEAVLRAVVDLKRALGTPDLFIANAGIGGTQKIKTFSSESANKTFDVNVKGLFHCVEAVVPEMIKNGSGHFVGISSLASFTSLPGMHVYAASKVAMRYFLSGMGLEIAKYGVDVSTICPGFIKTDLTAGRKSMPYLMELDDACERIEKAIEAKKELYAFPKRLYWIIRLGNLLPNFIRNRLN